VTDNSLDGAAGLPLDVVMPAINLDRSLVQQQRRDSTGRVHALADLTMGQEPRQSLSDPAHKCLLCLSSLPIPISPLSDVNMDARTPTSRPAFDTIGEALSRAQAEARAFRSLQERGDDVSSEGREIGQNLLDSDSGMLRCE
jgi:hypothetical protein